MAQFETWLTTDLEKMIKPVPLWGTAFTQDNQANLIGVRVYDGGEPATLGGSVSGKVIRADGATVSVSGTVSGNEASIVLPQAAYAVPGPIAIAIALVNGSAVITLAACTAYVTRTSTDTIVDPGTILPSIDTLIAQIDEAIASIPADYSALLASIAPAFSASAAYEAGQYVWYNGTLYRFTADHAAGTWDGTQAAAVNLSGDMAGLQIAIDLQNTADGIIPADGGSGTFTDSTTSVIKTGNIVKIDGEYTASTRRRFKVSGNFANAAGAVPAGWYADEIFTIPGGKVYGIEAIEIGGSVAIPADDTGYAANYQVFDTTGALVMTAYRYGGGWRLGYVNFAPAGIGAVVLTINKNYVFTNYELSFRIAEQNMDGVGFVNGSSGNDANIGSKTSPLKTVGRAISYGYRHICAAPGVYNEKINLTDGEFELTPWVDGQAFASSVPYRPKIELINGEQLTVSSAGNNIYTAPFTAGSESNMYKVFVGKTVSPTTQGSLALEYNAMLIGDKPNGTSGNNRKRLYTPVLTEGELSDQGTFYYDGTTIQFHPWGNVLDDNYYIPNDDADIGLSLRNMNKVHLEDVRIIGCYSYCAYLQECDNVTINACEFAYSAKGMGLGLDNCNARVSDCHASACAVDGFNLHKYGYSEFYDCTSFYNGDDGISHHQGCTGIIDGGEWAYNGSGGITPAFGCSVDVHNVFCHHNLIGLQFLGSAGNRRSLRCAGCLLNDNTQSDLYAKYYDITAWNCAYGIKEVDLYATITEYNNKVLE